jgi:L-lactate dehydrogenase complex protein LldG
MQSNSRQEILNRIEAARKGRLAFVEPSFDAEDIYKPILPDAIHCFKNELEAVNGQCVLCKDEADKINRLKEYVESKNFTSLFCRDSSIAKQLKGIGIPFSNEPADFENMQVGITGCEFLVARTGSVLVSSASASGRQMNVFPPVHIVLAHASQLVNYLSDALVALQEKYGEKLPSSISTITGPSRTSDIEKTLILGAHGPKEFIVFLSKI